MVHEAHAAQISVTGALGDRLTVGEVSFGIDPEFAVGADHSEVVIRDRAPMFVPRITIGIQRTLVSGERLLEFTLNICDDSEILFDARPEFLARSANLEGADKALSRVAE